MDPRVAELIRQGDQLFTKRGSLLSLWQEMADQFYVERGDFTFSRSLGTDFAAHLMTSYPLLVRRDLGDAISAMLRPTSKEWFSIRTMRPEREDEPGRAWLERAAQIMRRAMYDRAAMFTRATKEGDHDFATFGQCVISNELNRARDALLFRCWHLRDVVWSENAEGKVDTVHRKWKPTARDQVKIFGAGKVAQKVRDALEREPYTEFECRHIVMPADEYAGASGKKLRTPFVSIYVDVANAHVIEEVGVRSLIYVIPRWQTVSGSQYAYSPATVAALPQTRLIQAMTLTLLEAGEKAVNPPLIATQQAIRSDLALYAGGVTYADSDYDERKGDVLRPIDNDSRAIPIGIDLLKDSREIIGQAFYLNKLSMPSADGNPEMTAFEVGQRVQQYIRQALPLFEPLEMEYNGALCESTFDLLLRNGAFGPLADMPPSLRGAEVQFKFESPLADAIEAQKGQKLAESKALLAQVIDLDPTAPAMLDAKVALRDALRGIGTPAKWLRTEDQMDSIDQKAAQQQQVQQAVAAAGQGANVAKTLGQATQAFKAGGVDSSGVAAAA